MYYWDGQGWVSTLSPDGRFRWNGTAWVAAAGTAPAPYPTYSQRTVREPTSWTRPLQYAVAAWYAINALYTLALPFFLGGMLSQMMEQTFRRQQELNPDVPPPPPEFLQAMTSFMQITLWAAVIFVAAISAVFIVAAVRRWTWAYYVILVLLGLGVLAGPLNLVSIFVPGYNQSLGYSFPVGFYIAGFVAWIPGTALFVWMLVALIKRGPWAMRRVS